MECTIRELDCSLKTALTKDQCRCLAELINNYLHDEIKTNPLADFHYIKDMINAHDVLVHLWSSDDAIPSTLEIIPSPQERPFNPIEVLTDE